MAHHRQFTRVPGTRTRGRGGLGAGPGIRIFHVWRGSKHCPMPRNVNTVSGSDPDPTAAGTQKSQILALRTVKNGPSQADFACSGNPNPGSGPTQVRSRNSRISCAAWVKTPSRCPENVNTVSGSNPDPTAAGTQKSQILALRTVKNGPSQADFPCSGNPNPGLGPTRVRSRNSHISCAAWVKTPSRCPENVNTVSGSNPDPTAAGTQKSQILALRTVKNSPSQADFACSGNPNPGSGPTRVRSRNSHSYSAEWVKTRSHG